MNKKNNSTDRRSFIKKTGIAAGGLMIVPRYILDVKAFLE